MARTLAILLPLSLLALSQLPSAAAVRTMVGVGRSDRSERLAAVAASIAKAPSKLPLCDPQVVEETCALIRGGAADAKSVASAELQELLSAHSASIAQLWEALGLAPGDAIDCSELCSRAIDLISRFATLPPVSDTGCYVSRANRTFCNVDLDTLKVLEEARYPGDLPDFHDQKPSGMRRRALPMPDVPGQDGEEPADVDQGIAYSQKDMLLRVANLYRIYPATDVPSIPVAAARRASSGASSLVESEADPVADWLANLRLVGMKYVETALRMFAQNLDSGAKQTWFGTAGSDSRQIRKVLNSVYDTLDNSVFVYWGPECDDSTYAYVYSRGGQCTDDMLADYACARDTDGRFIVYMCPFTYESPVGEQIETVTHEGSHHAVAYTEDVCVYGKSPCTYKAYGRSTCRSLARSQPQKAIRNADNFCYYIQDLTDG